MVCGQGRFGASNTVASRILCAYKFSMSIVARNNSSRGRPPIDTEELRARVNRSLLNALDGWIAAQPEPMTRAEAVRFALRDWLKSQGVIKVPNDREDRN